MKNEKAYGTTWQFNVIDQLQNGGKLSIEEKKCNLLQCGTCSNKVV